MLLKNDLQLRRLAEVVYILVQPRSSRRLCCTAATGADEASESSHLNDRLEHCQLLLCQKALEVVEIHTCPIGPGAQSPVMRLSTTKCAPVNQETLFSLLISLMRKQTPTASRKQQPIMKSAKMHPPRLVVLVTGAASGIGRATSLALASAGDAEALKFKVQLTAAAWVQPTYCPPIKSLAGQFIASEPRDFLCSAVDTGTCALALSCFQYLKHEGASDYVRPSMRQKRFGSRSPQRQQHLEHPVNAHDVGSWTL